ncbi:MAG TPA: MBL fold metallo-hydrolase [Candidatus Tectomicrobia bacterium]|nr:MBL fold metallo-hydrolase [Candidatus Tectomicrobia bacterium]
MYVRFWGTRGSIATPGPQTARYGGNTSCVEVHTDDGTRIILDCGTGARALGRHLLRCEERPLRLHLFIGHTHWDHIQGFPFFDPAFLPDTELHIYAPRSFQYSLEDTLAGQMQYAYFPVKLADLRSCLHYTEVEEGCFWVGNVLVSTQYLNHTAPTIAYRLFNAGATLTYVTDHEPFWNPTDRPFRHPGDQRHIDFLTGSDLIIHDAQYTPEEYRSKVGWGHSTTEYATDVALAAGAARLALFHHDPGHDDRSMQAIEETVRDRIAANKGALEVFAAAEGMALRLHGRGITPPVAEASALQRRSIAGGRVMVVSADELQAASIARMLAEDELVLRRVPNCHMALALAPTMAPDLVIINQGLPDGDGIPLMRALRTQLRRRNLPIILLTDGVDGEVSTADDLAAASDYLATPMSLPMLRTRVRTCLMRTLSQSPTRSRRQPRCTQRARS